MLGLLLINLTTMDLIFHYVSKAKFHSNKTIHNFKYNTMLKGPENFDKGLLVVKTGISEDCD